MKSVILPSPRKTWMEAEVVGEPRRAKDLEAPAVLVRRRKPLVLGPNGEEMIYLEGPSAISLFTGAGGMDIGLEQAGFCCLCQHEWEWSACETLVANRPNFFRHAALIQGDIRDTPTSMILGEAGLRVGECHVVAGGPPCQGFSASGKRQADDIRNTLVYEYVRVVREARPRFFIFENVPGFTSLDGGSFMKAFLAEAHAAYYELVYGIANAVEYGVPQDRNRFLCMGTRRDLAEIDGFIASLPGPTHHGRSDLDYLEAGRRGSLFGVALDSRSEMLTHPPGVRYFVDRPVLVPPSPTSGGGGRNATFLEFYGKLLREEPDRIVRPPHGLPQGAAS